MDKIIFDCDGVITDFVIGFYNWYNFNHYDHIYGPISKNPQKWNFDFLGDL